MTFTQAIKVVLTEKYATFNGRAGRPEFWWYSLFTALVFVPLYFWAFRGAFSIDGTGQVFNPTGLIAYLLAAAVLFLPTLAVEVRRLHDTGRSGWWLLLSLIPYVGPIALLVMLLLPSEPDNTYGPGVPVSAVAAPAGWYADPAAPAQQRYWDGTAWTEHTTAPVYR